MRDLSEASGVPVATIKFYLRERLLQPGEHTHPNQSLYTDSHVRQIRLIRALTDVGGLSVSTAKAVIGVLDLPGQSVHSVLSLAHRAMAPLATTPDTAEFRDARNSVDALLYRLGWDVSPDNPGRDGVAIVLSTVTSLQQPQLTAVLEPYARAVESVALADLEAVTAAGAAHADRDAMVETAVIGVVVGDALLLHLRRLAKEHISSGRLSRPPFGSPSPERPRTTDPSEEM
jgi:DNA-binding transcriptional MerR regulator